MVRTCPVPVSPSEKQHHRHIQTNPLNPASGEVVRRYGKQVGINADVHGFAMHRYGRPLPMPGAQRRYRQGPGVAGTCQRLHHPAVRQASASPGRQPDVSGGLLKKVEITADIDMINLSAAKWFHHLIKAVFAVPKDGL